MMSHRPFVGIVVSVPAYNNNNNDNALYVSCPTRSQCGGACNEDFNEIIYGVFISFADLLKKIKGKLH